MHLRLAASMTVAEYLVPGWLRQLAVAAPGATVYLEMGNTARVGDLVAAGAVEVGFVEGVRLPARMKSKDLLVDELAIVVGVKHPWARRRKPVTATELAGTPLLMREPGSGTRDVLTDELTHHGLVPSVLMELGSTTAIKAAAVAGTAPAVLSKLAVAAELTSGSLVEVPFEGLYLRRVIRAIWASTRRPSGVVSQLISLAGASQT
jgi:DNA-binding transcriptional LysR family regulator